MRLFTDYRMRCEKKLRRKAVPYVAILMKYKCNIFTAMSYFLIPKDLALKFQTRYISDNKLGLVADPVFEAIARLEFKDGMRTGVLPGGCWGP